MTDIEVIEETPKPATELLVPKPVAGGTLAFYSHDGDTWAQATPIYPVGAWPDGRRFPFPLFPTREDAVEACKKYMPLGGKIKLWRIEF
jgi:hypothetical protein